MEPESFEVAAKLFCQAIAHAVILPTVDKRDLTPVQFAGLRFILLHKEPSVSDVASGLSISTAAATNLVERLVKKALVKRQENPEDRRLLRLALTSKGKELLEAVRSDQLSRLSLIMNQMSPEAVENLARGMRDFVGVSIQDKILTERICLHCGILHFADCPVNLARRRLEKSD